MEDKDDMSQPQKKVPTAFDIFVMEFKERQKEKCVVFLRGEEELLEKAALMWNEMVPRQKHPYEEAARKKRIKADRKETTNAWQKRPAQLCREKLQATMEREIEGPVLLVDTRSSLVTSPFHIAHVNYFCEFADGTYNACEIAVAEFTFADGVRKTYHTLIDPGAIPVGYNFEAEQRSATTHNIPLPPRDFGGETNYETIVFNIKQLLMGDNRSEAELPPLYSRPDDIHAVESVLGEFQKRIYPSVHFNNAFRVSSLTELFYNLWNASLSIAGETQFASFGRAERLLSDDEHEFAQGMSCYFHEDTEGGGRYCSLSFVRRWSFVILGRCCRVLDIPVIPGRHCPLRMRAVSDSRSTSSVRNLNTADCDFGAPSDLPGQPLSCKKECAEEATFQIEEKRQMPQEKVLKPLRRPSKEPFASEVMLPPANKKDDYVLPPPEHCPDQE